MALNAGTTVGETVEEERKSELERPQDRGSGPCEGHKSRKESGDTGGSRDGNFKKKMTNGHQTVSRHYLEKDDVWLMKDIEKEYSRGCDGRESWHSNFGGQFDCVLNLTIYCRILLVYFSVSYIYKNVHMYMEACPWRFSAFLDHCEKLETTRKTCCICHMKCNTANMCILTGLDHHNIVLKA